MDATAMATISISEESDPPPDPPCPQQKDHAEATIPEISEEYKQWKLFHLNHDMI